MVPVDPVTLGRLLQLSSAALPVGAFAYSECLEYLVAQGRIQNAVGLRRWLSDALAYGPIQVDAAILYRAMAAAAEGNAEQLCYWDAWLGATRESEELRAQSKNMARALWRLAEQLGDGLAADRTPEHFVSVYALVAVRWQLPAEASIYAYVHSWLANLISAGVKLIPLGQTAGQQLLWNLHGMIQGVTEFAMRASPEDLYSWNTGQALASMGHETLYSRLFRS